MTIHNFDLLVVGGGINGTGIARDAAGRHLSVCLCEQHDLASHTSSASTKLIHGGLRYLEYYEFALVSKALAEREILLRQAPHIVRPLHFILPHQPHLRPTWIIRAGLLLYDHLGFSRRTLPRSRRLNLAQHPAGQPLKQELHTGFMYCDAQVQDARLVVLNAMDAAQRGARILTRTRCVRTRRDGAHWLTELEDAQGRQQQIRTRAIVNAAGPWAVTFLDHIAQQPHQHTLRLVKGSHIVVPRLFEHEHAYIFQQPDRRIVFAIPYEQHFTLIGTTDVDYVADPANPHIDAAETMYLCNAVNSYFRQQITPEDVLWSYSGVRPLLNDGHNNASKVTRDYQLEILGNSAPLLNVFGGKLTTYRKLSEEASEPAMRSIGPPLPCLDCQWATPAWRRTPRHRSATKHTAPTPPMVTYCHCATPDTQLRHLCRNAARQCHQPTHPGNSLWRRPVSSRSRLPAHPRMGMQCRRHPLAPQQTRPAFRCAWHTAP